jgi:hypothetical protein
MKLHKLNSVTTLVVTPIKVIMLGVMSFKLTLGIKIVMIKQKLTFLIQWKPINVIMVNIIICSLYTIFLTTTKPVLPFYFQLTKESVWLMVICGLCY